MFDWRSIFYGGIGGAAVTMFRTAQTLVSNQPTDIHFGLLVGLSFLFVLGAALACASSDTSPSNF